MSDDIVRAVDRLHNRLERMETKIDNISCAKVSNRMFTWLVAGAYGLAFGSYGFCIAVYLKAVTNVDKIYEIISK